MVFIKVKNYGTMSFAMDYDNAPISAANFVYLARAGFYDGLTFHRIIKGFMIQGGDGRKAGKGPNYRIKGEFAANGVNNNLSHVRGVISMARTYIPDSADSQFFIVHKDSKYLDGQYAAFGHIVDGIDVLDMIASVPTNKRDDSPRTPVVIEKAWVEDEPIGDFPKIR